MEKFSLHKKLNFHEKITSLMNEKGFYLSPENPVYESEKFNFERNITNEGIKEYFKENNFIISEPIPLKLENATTLFVSSGIQKLEDVIHKEQEFPKKPLFINQPVLRSQFLGSDATESHTSFHNLTTLDLNINLEKHFDHFEKWINFLIKFGFKKEDFLFILKEDSPKLGNIKYENIIIKVFYGGLEIGDAVFIPLLPQKTRPGFSISDIGFGLERLNHNANSVNIIETDCLKTLALLSLSGVEPSNNNHGYRFRMFSKRLVCEIGMNYTKLEEILNTTPKMIEGWSDAIYSDDFIKKDDVVKSITIECERNFNRNILDFLEKEYGYKNKIDINQPTVIFINQLEKIGDKSKEFWGSIRNLLEINIK